jgi:DNA repair protein RadC
MSQAGNKGGTDEFFGGNSPIRSWTKSDRPRERLRALGARALSLRELLAILVGSGGRFGSALDVADRLLNRLGTDGFLRRLATVPPGLLEAQQGIGSATAARILASLELGRRAAVDLVPETDPIRGPEDVFARLGPLLKDLRQEEFHALLLNTQHRVLRTVLVTRGILDASLIHPREVFRSAVAESASGIILVHNHPSGDPSPSREDRLVTRQLSAAGSALGIPVLDHVIIGEGRYFSLAGEGGWGNEGRPVGK